MADKECKVQRRNIDQGPKPNAQREPQTSNIKHVILILLRTVAYKITVQSVEGII